MFSLQDAEHPQHRHRRRVRRLPGHRQGGLATTWTSSARTASAPSTRSTGRACWRRWCTTSPATSRPRSANDERVSFAVPSGNFGNICAGHVARMMGLPIGRLVAGHQRERRARRVLPHRQLPRARAAPRRTRPRARRWTSARPRNFERFVFDLLGRDGARTRRAVRRRHRARRRLRASTAEEFARIAGFGFVSGSSTHADRLATIRDTWQRFGTMIDTAHRRRPEGGARASPRRRADDRARNRAAGQVRRDDPRGAGPRARRARRRCRASRRCPSASTCCRPMPSAVKRYIARAHACLSAAGMTDAAADAEPGRGAGAPAARRGRPRASRETETVSTFDALGRVLAVDVRSALDVPPADNSSMDGYALRAADVRAAGARAAGEPAHPGRRGRRAAGAGHRGAHLHRRADSGRAPTRCVMQEQCEAVPGDGLGARARARCAGAGRWIRRRGEDVRARRRGAGARRAADAAGAGPGRQRRRGDAAGGAPAARGAVLHRRRTGDARRAAASRARSTTPTASRCAGCCRPAAARSPTWASCPTGCDATREALRRAAQGHDLILTSRRRVGRRGRPPAAGRAGRRPARAVADRHQAGQAAGLRRGAPPATAGGAVHRPAGQPGVELRHLPAGGGAGAARAAGRRRRRCRPALPLRADFDWPRPTSGASSCACGATRDGGLDLFPNQSSGVLTSTVWADGLVDNPPGQVDPPRRYGTLPAAVAN